MEEEENKNIIEELKEYLQGKDFEGFSFEDDDGKEIDIKKIKNNLVKFSEYYIMAFNEFYKYFKDYSSKKIPEIIEKNQKITLKILMLNSEMNKTNFGNDFYEKKINNYIKDKYFDMIDFFNFFMEVFRE